MDRIEDQIRKYEPRVEVTSVSFIDGDESQMLDNHTLHCKIEFNVRNAPQQTEEVNIFLQRIR